MLWNLAGETYANFKTVAVWVASAHEEQILAWHAASAPAGFASDFPNAISLAASPTIS
jgi:hypothetical protein